jgi:ATP-dependent RNA helicase DDX19/DBP5
MEKEARDRVVEEFRSGTTKILIATDVLARGFDVTQVPPAGGSLHPLHNGVTSAPCLHSSMHVFSTAHHLTRCCFLCQVTLVVNYDVPVERDSRKPAFETYLHRIGRSGRFGRRGAAFNLVNGAQVGISMLRHAD